MVMFPHDNIGAGGNNTYLTQQQQQHISITPDPNCCKRCGISGCDLKVLDCGCCLHARCTPLSETNTMTNCPVCNAPRRSLLLMPMTFDEIDRAKAAAAAMAPSGKRGKKRRNATIARLNPAVSSTPGSGGIEDKSNAEGADLRTGRWTTEETAYCDKLIVMFERGQLPIVDGIKLNDFLSNMLKSKQSRLTKKMKNARLSTRSYKRTTGYVVSDSEAREFSELEASFFMSIPCSLEKSEIRFHMEKEWRELYSSYCVAIGQKLDADSWLTSVEEMDRRASQAKDAARMARRKVMMGYALSRDAVNAQEGIFIEPSLDARNAKALMPSSQATDVADYYAGTRINKRQRSSSSFKQFSSPFVGRVVHYLQRHNIPFEHVDAWVPSFVSSSDPEQKCRLCFAGCATTETQIPPGGGAAVPLSVEEQFDLLSFGDYSQKFSFDVGCGLPGRVYSSGVASWEQGIQKAPSSLFERCGGAAQWDIKTVLGIPVPSPNVGRIVVLMYSRHDRKRNQETVSRISEMLTKLLPTPKWKLVVDVGVVAPRNESIAESQVDLRPNELLILIRHHTPADKSSPAAAYLPGFTSLRLLLQKPSKTSREEELCSALVESYSSYRRAGRSPADVACMVARDYMLLAQQANMQPQQQHQSLQQQQPVQHQQPPQQQQQPPQQQQQQPPPQQQQQPLQQQQLLQQLPQQQQSTQQQQPPQHQHLQQLQPQHNGYNNITHTIHGGTESLSSSNSSTVNHATDSSMPSERGVTGQMTTASLSSIAEQTASASQGLANSMHQTMACGLFDFKPGHQTENIQ